MSNSNGSSQAKGGNAQESVQQDGPSVVKIFLSALDYRDREMIRSWRNHYSIWRWSRQTVPISDLEQDRWFQKQSSDQSVQMFKIMLSLIHTNKAPQEVPVGVCGFSSIDHLHKRAEFSIYIAPQFQKKGAGFAALNCLLHHGFDNLGFNVIWGESFDGNPACNLFEKVGFFKEGTRRDFYFKNGKFIDAHIYSLKRDEWKTTPCLVAH